VGSFPGKPPGFCGRELGQRAVFVESAHARQAGGVAQMIPETLGFLVVEHEGEVVGPTAGSQGQDLSVDFAAVHGSQINQRSIRDGDVQLAKDFIGHLVLGHHVDGIGTSVVAQCGPHDAQVAVIGRIAGISR